MSRMLLRLTTLMLTGAAVSTLVASDDDLIPKQFSREQRDKIQQFLKDHEKPKQYIPADAKIVGEQPGAAEKLPEVKTGETVKQYLVQIMPHRPVPGQEEVKRVDVFYYRPNPAKGKPGVTIKHTLDVTTGKEVGTTEVLLNGNKPLAREEVNEGVDLAKSKSEPVQALYKKYDKEAIHWEFLQLTINKKQEELEPGDRAVMLTFTVTVPKDQDPPAPVQVIADVTKGVVVPAPR
jgi:hypothetical protein